MFNTEIQEDASRLKSSHPSVSQKLKEGWASLQASSTPDEIATLLKPAVDALQLQRDTKTKGIHNHAISSFHDVRATCFSVRQQVRIFVSFSFPFFFTLNFYWLFFSLFSFWISLSFEQWLKMKKPQIYFLLYSIHETLKIIPSVKWFPLLCFFFLDAGIQHSPTTIIQHFHHHVHKSM